MFNRRNILIGTGVFLVLLVYILIPRGGSESPAPERSAQPAENSASAGGAPAVEKRQANTGQSAQQLYTRARKLLEDRQLVEAKQVFQELLNNHPGTQDIEEIERNLAKINMELIFSNTPVPQSVTHEVVPGDTLGELAKKYGTTVDLIKKSNNLGSDVIRVGQKLRVWTGEFNVYVDKSQNILILRTGNEVVKVYDVATGKNNSTPVGEFKVSTKLTDPVWYNKGVVVPPESPANELGSRWLGFDIQGYGIHGTTRPETIGTQSTAGCVRMRNSDVEELFSLLTRGTLVKIVD